MAGKRGPAPKKENRQGHRKDTVVSLKALPAGAAVPKAPDGLLKTTSEKWDTFWRSEIAGAVADVDAHAVERLFRYYDEWNRLHPIMAESPMVEGSVGQVRVNPIAKRLEALEGEISSLEQQFGLTPLSRMRLGIAVGQAQLTAQEVNQRVQRRLSAADKDPEEADLEAEWEAAD